MIVFDQETRQFSVVEESREFAYRIGGGILPFKFVSDREGAVSSIIRSAQGKDSQKLRAKNDKRAHKERMAMIKMGMDPSNLESQSMTQDRMRYADRADKRSHKGKRRDQKFEREMARFNAGADHEYRMKQLDK